MINIQNAARVFTALEYRRRYFLLTKIVLLYMTLDIQQDERKIETIKPTNPAETARETLWFGDRSSSGRQPTPQSAASQTPHEDTTIKHRYMLTNNLTYATASL